MNLFRNISPILLKLHKRGRCFGCVALRLTVFPLADIHALVDEVSLIYKRDSIKLRLKLIIDLLLAAGKRNEEPVLDDSVCDFFVSYLSKREFLVFTKFLAIP